MFDGMHNIFKVTAGYNSTYHHRMGWVVGDIWFSLNTLLYFQGEIQVFPGEIFHYFSQKKGS